MSNFTTNHGDTAPCRSCGEEVALDAFPRCRGRRRSECRPCKRAGNRVYMARTRAADPELAKARLWKDTATYRARRYGHEIFAHLVFPGDVVALWGDRCAYCPTGSFEVLEHLVPIQDGGPHSILNTVPACFSCNRRKADAEAEHRSTTPVPYPRGVDTAVEVFGAAMGADLRLRLPKVGA